LVLIRSDDLRESLNAAAAVRKTNLSVGEIVAPSRACV
jgi:hypothetical protein